ncbi:MAG: hypothetical protein NZ601_01295 [candidate division WOR-3 bacterium]|nr:hypothetical protein [candidate division WOR-3 bacterium]MDW7987819.1 hypothetical protein [candidate division WOR-3 bacterium]
MKCQIIFTVDNGEEFGCRLVQNHRWHLEENAHLERSHWTDDEEFYIPRVFKIESQAKLLTEGLRYNYRKCSALDFKIS